MHLDNQFRRAIADAALKGDLESVKRLSKGSDHYKGAFYRAAAHDHLKIVEYLIEFPSMNTAHITDFVIYSAVYFRHFEMIKYLAKASKDKITIKDRAFVCVRKRNDKKNV